MAKDPNTYHHIVPQCYLSNFANDGKNKFVYVYDKTINKVYTKAIKDICGIDNFYTISSDFIESSIDNKIIEKEFFANNVEKEYSKQLLDIISNVREGKMISDELKYSFAINIVIQFLRTKEVREKDDKLSNDMLPKIIRLFKEGLAIEKQNPQIAEIDIDYKFDSVLNHYNSSFGNPDIVISFAKELSSNYWTFYFSSSPVFYTSSFPIIVNPHVENVRPLNMGLTQYGAELSFPLSPNILLVIWDKHYFKQKETYDKEIIAASDKQIRAFNWLRYLYTNQVYSQVNDFFTLDFIYNSIGKHMYLNYK